MSNRNPLKPNHPIIREKFLKEHGRVLGLYAVLTLILSWPLIPRIFTHVPGVAQWAFDESTFVWNIWYFKHAVVDNLSSPLHTDLVYYPLGIDLILYTYNFFHALIAQPLYIATNLPFASNVALILSTILSGFGTFLLTRYLLSRPTNRQRQSSSNQSPVTLYAPIIAGLLYAFASNRAIYAALGHYDMVTTQWIPFYALALLQSLDAQRTTKQRLRSAALAGIFFGFNGLAEMITALFMAIFTLIVVLIMLVRSLHSSGTEAQPFWTRELWGRLVGSLAVTGVVAAVIWGSVLVPILNQFITDDFSLKGWGEAIPLSTDLLGWFTPTTLHPLWGGDLVAELRRIKERAIEPSVTGFRDINTVYIGMVSLLLALAGAFIYRARVRLWIWTAAIFGIFTLGPFLQINGQYRFDLDGVEATFPLPYALLHYIPVIKANRAPNRNSVVLMLAVAVLAAFAIQWIMQRLTVDRQQAHPQAARPQVTRVGSVIALILAGLIVFEHLTLPFPLTDARVPAVYNEIAADPNPVSVMQFPLGWRDSFGTYGPERTLLQYYQSTHGKPMLGGNISRAPDFKMGYFERLPFFQAFRNVQSGDAVDEGLRAAAVAQSDELMALYNVGYAIFYPPIEERPPYSLNWEQTWQFAKEILPLEEEPFWTGDGIEAYRVLQAGQDDAGIGDSFRLDLGEPGTLAYRGEGWDSAETDAPNGESAIWSTDGTSRILVPLRNVDSGATYRLSIRVHPFGYSDASPKQAVGLTVNGTPILTQVIPELAGWHELAWEVPGDLLVNSLNRLALEWAWTAVPREVIPGSRQIGATGVDLPIDVDVKGFADGGFIALFDEDGDQSDGSVGRMGVNVTVLDPITGNVDEMAGFDTTANTYEAQELAAYLNGIPAGYPVLVVSRGPAWQNLTEEAIAGLQGIGAELTLDGIQQNYVAIAGVQGASPGSAAQVVDPSDAFLRVSLNRDRRALGGAVDWIEIGKQ